MKIYAEMTDTFGGEANYCWVKRFELEDHEGLTDLQIIRRLKAGLGISGVKCDKAWDSGDTARYDIRGACVCFFVICEY